MKRLVLTIFCMLGVSTAMAYSSASEVQLETQLDQMTIDGIDSICAPQTSQSTCAAYLNALKDIKGNQMSSERVNRLVAQVKQHRFLRLNKNLQIGTLANELVN